MTTAPFSKTPRSCALLSSWRHDGQDRPDKQTTKFTTPPWSLILTGHFGFLWRFPLTTRSQTSVPRSPFPVPRSPFPVPRFSNILLLLLLTTFWIASSRSNWFVAKMNIVSFKSSSLHTFNKDVFYDSFNVRNCQDCSCWPWNRERKVEVVQKFFKVNGRDSFAGDWSFLFESPQQIR